MKVYVDLTDNELRALGSAIWNGTRACSGSCIYTEMQTKKTDCSNCPYVKALYSLIEKFSKPKLLADYTKQVRKEVIGQVRDIARKIARPTTEYDGGEFDYDIDGVTLDNLLMWLEDEELDLLKNFLDQIQGETKC